MGVGEERTSHRHTGLSTYTGADITDCTPAR